MKSMDKRRLTVIHDLEEIPADMNEEQARDFFDTHEFSDELWDKAGPIPDELAYRLQQLRQRRAGGSPAIRRRA
jgi:hypothetical protein